MTEFIKITYTTTQTKVLVAQPCITTFTYTMYKICFYVPIASSQKVKSAVFQAGAGKIGNYDSCCWENKGMGQFRPLENAQPAIGTKNELSYVEEFKVEIVCKKKYLKSCIKALLDSHPYEEPAYHFWKIQTELPM